MLKFSIIIPAHNEARYIENTLTHVQGLDYPKELYEVIVVENGSNDGTYEMAKRFEGGNITVLQSEKGVSRAKNKGIDAARADSDWLIFLDADTVLEKNFLNELNEFLSRPNHYSVGTVSLLPQPHSRKARAWFAFYDIMHRLTKSSYSLKIAKRSLFPTIRFDEATAQGEDLQVIQRALKHGRFFFMRTKNALTSTRRFEQMGWWRLCYIWTFGALLPAARQRMLEYPVVR